MKKNKILISLLLSVLIISSCLKEFERPEWDVDLKAPLFYGSLTIGDLIPDSILEVGDDEFVSLVYENDIYRFSLDSFISMPDTGSYYAAYLDSIKVSPVTIIEEYTLGNIISDAGLAGFIIDGSVLTIPPLNGLSSNDIPIDVSDVFQTMTLAHGFLDITIQNNLPIDITNMIFELKNTVAGDVVLLDTFAIIPSGDSFVKTVDLTGKTISGNLTANILNMDSPGSNGDVTIDYSDALITTFYVYELEPLEATAIFPSQNIINSGDVIYFDLGEIELTEMIAKEGMLTLDAVNTLETEVHFIYELPGLIKDGEIFIASGTVGAAVGGQATILHSEHDMSGYHLDLRGPGPIESALNEDLNYNGVIDNDTINTIFVLPLVSIDSTGNLISLSLQDSFIFESALTGLIPEYAKGYLGRDTFPAKGIVDIDVFKEFPVGSISLEDANISLEISNQIGVEAGFFIDELIAVNEETGDIAELIITGIDNPFLFSDPIDPNSIDIPVDPVIVQYTLNNSNSNASDLINVFPDHFSYSTELYLNPGNPPPFPVPGNDFIYNDSELKAAVNIEIPLSLVTNNLILTDTLGLGVPESTINNINSGKIFLTVKNMFPLNAQIELSIYNELTETTYPLTIPVSSIIPAEIDAQANKVLEPTISHLEIDLTNNDVEKLVGATGLIAKIIINSDGVDEYIKLYSSYSLDIIVSADVNYHMSSE